MYSNGDIIDSAEGVEFKSRSCFSFYAHQSMNFESFRQEIQSRLQSPSEMSIKEITYRFPISIINDRAYFKPYIVKDDGDLRLLFDSYIRNFPRIQAAEINVESEEITSGASGQVAAVNEEDVEDEYDSNDEDDPDFRLSEQDDDEGDEDGEFEDEETMSIADPPADMTYLDLDAMVEQYPPELQRRNFLSSVIGDELEVGMRFQNKEDVQDAIKHYSVRKWVDFKVTKSNPTKYTVKCTRHGEGCRWRTTASFRLRSHMWEISEYNGPHTCTAGVHTLDHRKLDSNMVCRCILPLVKKNSSLAVAVLQAAIKARFNHEPSYRKTWIAKQKAIEVLFGNWEKSFEELPPWLAAMEDAVPGSIVRLEAVDRRNEQGEVTERVFSRLFWSFRPCIEAFKHCKRLVQIDGTHLYGKYRGTLLIAVSQDGNRKVVPLAFAIVEGETYEDWKFFLDNLRTHVTPQDGICFISDRHESIKKVMREGGPRWRKPQGYHVYCIRHIGANILRTFHSPGLKSLMVNAGKLLHFM
jgi:hypothetical protein